MEFAEEAITKAVTKVTSDASNTLTLAEQFSECSFQSVWQLNEPSFPFLSDLSVLSSSTEFLYSSTSRSSSMPELTPLNYNYDADLEDSVPDSV